MKKILLFLFLSCSLLLSAQYDAWNIKLYSRFDDPSVPFESRAHARYNSCYGYYDALNHREYGILGATTGTYIIDVTDPTHPVQVAFMEGSRVDCLWREYKTYKQFLYAVSDDPGNNSLQIFDLSKLPEVTKVYESDSIFATAHTISVDGDKLYAASVKSKLAQKYKMAVYSLANPVLPKLLRGIDADDNSANEPAHDMFVRNDTVIVSFGYSGLRIYIFDPLKPAFTLVGQLKQYHNGGYNHSSVLTPDGKTLVFTDEVPNGLPAKIADVSDFGDIKLITDFHSTVAANASHPTPHNPYLVGKDKVVISYYMDGVQVFDISDHSKPRKIGFFDTYPDNGNTFSDGYAGCWGAYVDLPSGTLLASDMQRGLFVLNANSILHPERLAQGASAVRTYPTRLSDNLTIEGLVMNSAANFSIYDTFGNLHYTWKTEKAQYSEILSMPYLQQGLYIMKIETGGETRTLKLVK